MRMGVSPVRGWMGRLSLTVGALGSLAGVASAAVYEQEIDLGDRGLEIRETGEGLLIDFDGAAVVAVPGAPAVPSLRFRVALPADDDVRSVALLPIDVDRLNGVSMVPAVDPESPPGTPAVRRADAYGHADWMDGASDVAIATIGYRDGYRLAVVELTPVRALPAEERVEITRRFRVRIETGVGDRPSELARSLRGAPRDISGDVDWVLAHPAPVARRADEPQSSFRPTETPSLEGSPVDFVIVTAAAYEAEFQRLADHRTATGMRTVVRTVDWIADRYEGEDLAASIRLFLRDAHIHWGTGYALLGGDTADVPVRYARARNQFATTDYYYSCLDGDWNANGNSLIGEAPQFGGLDGDESDFVPDIYVGRLPAGSVAEAATMVDKTLVYSGGMPDRFVTSHLETATFWAEALFPQEWGGGCDEFTSTIGDGAFIADPMFQCCIPEAWHPGTNHLYEAWTCWSDTNYVAQPLDLQAVINDFNQGRHVVVHVGHGSRDNMAVGASDQKVLPGNVDDFVNGDALSMIYAINCDSGAIDFDCIIERFLSNPNGGAFACVAATELDYPRTSQAHALDFFDRALGVNQPLGPSHVDGLFESFAADAAGRDNLARWTLLSLIYLGDPTIRMWDEIPMGLRVIAPDVALDAGTYMPRVFREGTFNGEPGVTLVLYKDGEVYDTAITDAAGEATFDFAPGTTGSFSVGASKDGFVPRVESAMVTDPAGEHLVVSGLVVDDSAGNGSGAADEGESVTVSVTVANRGAAASGAVTLAVSSGSSDISISGGAASTGAIGAGSEETSTPISVTVATPLSAGRNYVAVPLSIDLTSSAGTVSRTATLIIGRSEVEHVGLTMASGIAGGTVSFTVDAYNGGNGTPLGATASIVAVDAGSVNVTTGSASIALTPGDVSTSGLLEFDVIGGGDTSVDLTYADANGTLATRRLSFDTTPLPPLGVSADPAPDFIRLDWDRAESPRTYGYNLYREQGGSFVQVNERPLRGAFQVNRDLPPLSEFRFVVTTVDSTGQESAFSDTVIASTSPPLTAGWPLDIQGSDSRGSITFVEFDGDPAHKELVFGSRFPYMVAGDGTDVVDGDGAPATVGIFADELGGTSGEVIAPWWWAKPAVANLDLSPDGSLELVMLHADRGTVWCWNTDGSLAWGGSDLRIGSSSAILWSSPVIGNIDNDPELEVVFWSGGPADGYRGTLIAFNHDGTEVVDGDANPATTGPIWRSSDGTSRYNYSTVSLWDFDGDGRDEIVAGERRNNAGTLHLFDYEAGVLSEMAGWPIESVGGGVHSFTSSPAVGDVDDDGDYEIFASNGVTLFGLHHDGSAVTGFPKALPGVAISTFNDFVPSPVLGDFNGDGAIDVVMGWNSGQLYAYTAGTGEPLPGWAPNEPNIVGEGTDLIFFNGALANVDADDEPEFIVGTGGGQLWAFNADGSVLGGFPYEVGGIMFGAPAVWDMDRNGSPDIVALASVDRVISLEMTNAGEFNFDDNPWPQFRHNPRNTGVLGSGTGTTPIDLGSVEVLSTGPGRVDLRWEVEGRYSHFVIERADGSGPRRMVGELPGTAENGRYSFRDEGAPAGGLARYWITGYRGADREVAGPYVVNVQGQPQITALFQNAPNPFSPRTTIRYMVGDGDAAGELVRLEIFDVQGRRVASVVDAVQPAGIYSVNWDGRDNAGVRQAPGLYVYQLTVGAETFTKKLMLAR